MIICTAIFAKPSSAQAIPALPSSFFGTVKLNNANVLDGMVIQAFIGDRMIAQGYTQMYQGESVYSLDLPGDNTDTVIIDGGREGDTITFKVAGIASHETGTWHSATSVQLNLTVTSASTPKAPQATPPELPTQTPIVVIQPPSKTPTPTLLALPTAILLSLDTKSPDLPTSTLEQSTQLLPVSDDQATGSNKDLGKTIPIITLAVIVIIGACFLAWIRRRK
jgi:hypothetical protein